MASLFRREHKRKLADAAIEEECTIIRDAENWEDHLPDLIEKVKSTRSDIRLAALQSMNEILSGKYIGEDIDDYLEDVFVCLAQPITEPANRQEHDEAIGVLCNLALNAQTDMEGQANAFIGQILPTLNSALPEKNFRFFGVAFVAGICVTNEERITTIISKLTNLLTNKNARTVKYEPETTAALIRAIFLIVSLLPSELVAGKLSNQILSCLDKGLESPKTEVLLASLDALPLVYEAIVEEEENGEGEVSIDSNHFGARYGNKLGSVHERAERKADQKAIKARAAEVLAFIRGGESITEEVTFAAQTIEVEGARRVNLMSAIRRVTRHHFHLIMEQNTAIHDLLGFELRDVRRVLHEKKKNKKETVSSRAQNAKERKMRISNERRKKEFTPDDE